MSGDQFGSICHDSSIFISYQYFSSLLTGVLFSSDVLIIELENIYAKYQNIGEFERIHLLQNMVHPENKYSAECGVSPACPFS